MPSTAVVAPVLFDVDRLVAPAAASRGSLVERAPVLATANGRDAAAPFAVDPDLPLGSYRYRVRGIDLFGQVGESADSDPVEVRDLEAPPPPVRLQASLGQPGYPWLNDPDRAKAGQPATLEVGFEYGAGQYQQAPDAETFRVYWRPDSVFDGVPVTVTLESSAPPMVIGSCMRCWRRQRAVSI